MQTIETMIAEAIEKWKQFGLLPDGTRWTPELNVKVEVKGAAMAKSSAGSDDTHG